MALTKVKIEYGYNRSTRKHWCGIGDGVHDGMIRTGKTRAQAMQRFIDALNNDTAYTIAKT